MINNKKFYWVVIPLSIALFGSIAMNVVVWQFVKATNEWKHNTEIMDAKIRADKLIKLRDHLNNREIEETQALINGLFGLETSLLELLQKPDLYPESVSQHANRVLAEIESSFNQSSQSNEEPSEQ